MKNGKERYKTGRACRIIRKRDK